MEERKLEVLHLKEELQQEKRRREAKRRAEETERREEELHRQEAEELSQARADLDLMAEKNAALQQEVGRQCFLKVFIPSKKKKKT